MERLDFAQTLNALHAYVGQRVRVYVTPFSDRFAEERVIALELEGELDSGSSEDVTGIATHTDEWIVFFVVEGKSMHGRFILSPGDFDFGFDDPTWGVPALTWTIRHQLAVTICLEQDVLEAMASAEEQ